MAESPSMTTPEVVAKTLIDEHADFLAEAVAMVATQLMEAEITRTVTPAPWRPAQLAPGRSQRER